MFVCSFNLLWLSACLTVAVLLFFQSAKESYKTTVDTRLEPDSLLLSGVCLGSHTPDKQAQWHTKGERKAGNYQAIVLIVAFLHELGVLRLTVHQSGLFIKDIPMLFLMPKPSAKAALTFFGKIQIRISICIQIVLAYFCHTSLFPQIKMTHHFIIIYSYRKACHPPDGQEEKHGEDICKYMLYVTVTVEWKIPDRGVGIL